MRAELEGTRWAAVAALCALVVALAVVGCGDDNGGGGNGGNGDAGATYGAEDLDAPIEVGAGETFAIVLDSNPTTGYAWQLVKDPPAEVLTYEGSEYEPEPGAENREGAGGEETLTFKGVAAGETRIQLEYVFGDGSDANRDPATEEIVDVVVR